MHKHLFTFLILGALASGRLAVSPAHAQTALYHVSLGTSSLAASSSAPFSLDFQFDAGGTPGSNTVTLNNFMYGGGSAASSPSSTSGGATGNVNSAVTIINTSFVNELVQGFTPGGLLSFDLRTTLNLNTAPGSSPDEFSFALLDSNGNEIVTTAADSAFVTIDIDSANPTVTAAGTAAGQGFTIAAPTVTLTPAAVPEANGALAGFVGIAGLLAVVGLRRVRSRPMSL